MLRDINFFQIILENFYRKIFPTTLIYYVSIVRQNFYPKESYMYYTKYRIIIRFEISHDYP